MLNVDVMRNAPGWMNSVLTHLDEGVVLAQGRDEPIICFSNSSFAQMVDMSPSELVGMSLSKSLKSFHRGETLDSIDSLRLCAPLPGDEIKVFECTVKSPQGLRYIKINALPMMDFNGDSIFLFTDVSEEKVKEELKLARDAAIESARVKAEFLAGMSHEIRTPMNAVIGMTELVLRTDLTLRQRQLLGKVQSSGEVLLAVINDILDFSKIESGKLNLDTTGFDLREVIEECLDLMAVRAQAKGLQIVSLIIDDFDEMLRGDPARIKQIILNFLSNAIKFTEKGEIALRASKENETTSSVTVKFAVTDTGIGIPTKIQQEIFQPFTQADSSVARKYGGTGLGLTISKKLVELLKGTIGCESEEDRGSTFWCKLTFEKEEDGKIPSSLPLAFSGLRVLLIDENKLNLEALQLHLNRWLIGHDRADSGEQALASLRDNFDRGTPFDVVLVDSKLSGTAVEALCREVKQDKDLKSTLVVLMVPMNEDLKPSKLFGLGVGQSISKPIKRSALKDCLFRHFSESSLSKAASPSLNDHVSIVNGAECPPAKSIKPFPILVVDDNELNRDMAIDQLIELGYRSDAVSGGEEALDVWDSKPYRLILLDCQMPKVDGYFVASRIRKREGIRRLMPIIAMTAHAMQGDREKCLAAGMDDYISKPVMIKDLEKVLFCWDVSWDITSEPGGQGEISPENYGQIESRVKEFISTTPKHLHSLHQTLSNGSIEGLSQAAHALYGFSDNVRAKGLALFCTRLENLLSSGSIQGAKEFVDVIEQEHAKVLEAFNERL
ncbi:MAG: hypothetical protein COB53_00985 [Elusimicrobia bacterium]|nr:MAG: hypothetical protein COB53_00985 [Elusimicrobiota bacterium]